MINRRSQRGMSVSGIVFLLIALVLGAKLTLAIAPAQVGDYQLNKVILNELREANNNKATAKEFLKNLSQQFSINSVSLKVDEVITVTNTRPGQLTVQKKYEVAHNFFPNVDIVNRFDQTFTPADTNAEK